MNTNTLLRVLLLMGILMVGIWLLGRPGHLQPEGPARLDALRNLSERGIIANSAQQDTTTGEAMVYEPVSAAVVDFADVEIETSIADGMYDRWVRGEIDLDENDQIGSEAEMARLLDEALAQPLTANMQHASEASREELRPLSSSLRPRVAFDAIDFTESGGSVPPDPELAVGPNHIIAVVNVSVAIYDKRGGLLFGPTSASNLFSQGNCKTFLFDPNVLYDEEADRWILAYDKGQFQPTGGYCLLASQSGDPTGIWYEYFFPFNDNSVWMDFPHAGVGDRHIFMGANMFTHSGIFSEGRIFALDKSDLYSGAAVAAAQHGLGPNRSTPQPIKLHGYLNGTWPNHGDSHYFLVDYWNGQTYDLRRWNPVNNSLTLVGTIDLGASSQTIDAPQSGGDLMQVNDWRPLDFEYRNGYGWMTMTISCNPGSGPVNCLRWAQINLNNATLGPAGSGVYGSSTQHRFYGDLAVNHCNDMAIGYTRSGENSYPSIWVSGRHSTAPSGTLQPEIQLKAGELTYTAFDSSPRRWGDYTGMSIDPRGGTFWYVGQYSKDTGKNEGRWGTYVGSFTYAECNPPLPLLPESMHFPLVAR